MKYEIDYNDSQAMWKFQMDTLKIADDYADARRRYSLALKTLKVGLANAYRDNSIERKIAEDKAYLVLADRSEEYREALSELIITEGEYKGLEQVIHVRTGALSFNQSLIKVTPK